MLTQTAAPSFDETRLRVRIWLAFFAVYVLWGSTYLSIRIAVSLVPPLFAAASGSRSPAWRSISGVDYGASQRRRGSNGGTCRSSAR